MAPSRGPLPSKPWTQGLRGSLEGRGCVLVQGLEGSEASEALNFTP